MRVALLLVREGVEVLCDLKPHDTWRGIGEVIAKLLSIHIENWRRRIDGLLDLRRLGLRKTGLLKFDLRLRSTGTRSREGSVIEAKEKAAWETTAFYNLDQMQPFPYC